VDILITKDGLRTLMDVIIVDLIHTNMVQQALTTTTHVATMVAQKRHDPMSNKHHAMISFPLLLKCTGVFIFVLICFLLLVHISILHIINGLL
jgi:hypothetical protein